MQLTVIGSGDKSGIPVQGCLCRLCRQARAIRHLRRRPPTLLVHHQGEGLLVDAGCSQLERRLQQEPVDHALLSAWHPSNWHGLLPFHLGSGSETDVFGPASPLADLCLAREPGQLQLQPSLQPGQESLAGRFRILPFAISPGDPESLAYGIREGEQRLAYIPLVESYAPDIVVALSDWQPDLVVLGCPAGGTPAQRLARVSGLFERLQQANILLTGLDHHMDQWLQTHEAELPEAVRLASDDQRLDIAYVAEYRRLASQAF